MQMLYSVRSERLLMEEIDYSVLFRWFVGMNLDEAGMGRDRLHQEPGPTVGRRCGARVSVSRWWSQARAKGLISDEHFTRGRHADGSLGEPEELSAQG